MNPLITSVQLREWEAFSIQAQKISSFDLMERAASTFTDIFINKFSNKNQSLLFLIGPGNNGGDGLAIARILKLKGYHDIHIFENQADQAKDIETDRAKNKKLLKCLQGINWIQAKSELHSVLQIENLHVIDAVFGIGFNRALPDDWKSIFKLINDLNLHVTAVDIPSGLHADTGLAHDSEYQGLVARDTFTFQTYKPCMVYPESGNYCAQIEVLDIGLSPEFVLEDNNRTILLDKSIFNYRKQDQTFANKSTKGKVFQFCGSDEMSGACILSSSAALRAGSGYVYVLTTEKTSRLLLQVQPELIVTSYNPDQEFLSESVLALLHRSDSVLVGPGLGQSIGIKKILIEIIGLKLNLPLILDADALNALAGSVERITKWPGLKILTPHAKEFDRLFGDSTSWSQRETLMRKYSRELDTVIILKGAFTRIAFPDGTMYINTSGNSGLATAGSGDVLSGILSAFLAQEQDTKISILSAVYLHGRLADDLAKYYSGKSILPSDLIHQMGRTLKKLEVYG